MTNEEMLKEIEALKEKVEKLNCEYPKYMLAIGTNSCEQYIVKFTGLKEGYVVGSYSNGTRSIGHYDRNWIPYTDTSEWKEVNNPNELCDKDLVECWDNPQSHTRALRFYDAKNKCAFMYAGKREGYKYDNYRKLLPWEEAIFPWVEEARNSLGD